MGLYFYLLMLKLVEEFHQKDFLNKISFKTDLWYFIFLRLGADVSNTFWNVGNVFVFIWDDGVSSENISSVNNCCWPFDTGFCETKKSVSPNPFPFVVWVETNGGEDVASFF